MARPHDETMVQVLHDSADDVEPGYPLVAVRLRNLAEAIGPAPSWGNDTTASPLEDLQ